MIATTTRPSLADLRDELRAAGLGRPAPIATYAKFLLLMSGAIAGLLWVALHPYPLYESIPLGLFSAWLLTGAAMCGHDGAHAATSNRPWVNNLLAQAGFTLLGGLSIVYWRHKHNSLHHPNVNVGTKDPDVQQGLLALSTKQHARHGSLVRWLQQRFQAPVFWLVGAPLVLIDLKVTSIHFVFTQLFTKGTNKTALLVDLAWLVGHYAFWIGIPLLFLPVSTTLIAFAIISTGPGVFLAAIFAPAHVPYPVVEDFDDPLLLQLTSTRNLKTNWFFRFTLLGLAKQVEHHLAPTLPHFDLPRAAVIVRSYCERHGLPYNETSWLRALVDTTVQVRDGWRIDEVIVGAPAGVNP